MPSGSREAGRPRVLFVTETPPLPADHGARQRTNLLIRALRRFAEVDVLLTPQGGKGVTEDRLAEVRAFVSPGECELERHPAVGAPAALAPLRVLGAGAPALAARHLCSAAREFQPVPSLARAARSMHDRRGYDAAVGRYLRFARAAGLDGLGVRTIVDVDDFEDRREATRAEQVRGGVRRALARRQARRLSRRLPALRDRFDHLVVCSESDRELLAHRSISVAPNIPFAFADGPPAPLPEPEGVEALIVVGTWSYGPNGRGLSRFLDRVWPGVRAARPGAELLVVGGGLSGEAAARAGGEAGVRVLGRVDDIAAAYRSASAAVAPIYDGAGTKIKVLEALAYHRAVAVTEHAAMGFEHALAHGSEFLVGPTDEALAAACAELLADGERRRALAAAGRAAVETHFTMAAVERGVGEALRAVLGREVGSDG